jgi:hypothetical protein
MNILTTMNTHITTSTPIISLLMLTISLPPTDKPAIPPLHNPPSLTALRWFTAMATGTLSLLFTRPLSLQRHRVHLDFVYNG